MNTEVMHDNSSKKYHCFGMVSFDAFFFNYYVLKVFLDKQVIPY